MNYLIRNLSFHDLKKGLQFSRIKASFCSRTTALRSKPKGFADVIAAAAFFEERLPARHTGTLASFIMLELKLQSWILPVPPSILVLALGFPESSKI
ncbi:MAG: hypothetical protein ACI9IP_002948 [Arcticibacterium sp.]|jgi:hypothetical protein